MPRAHYGLERKSFASTSRPVRLRTGTIFKRSAQSNCWCKPLFMRDLNDASLLESLGFMVHTVSPQFGLALGEIHEAIKAPWAIAGGTIRDALLNRFPRDLDIVVDAEPKALKEMVYAINTGVPSVTGNKPILNSFGGYKFKSHGVEVDMWPLTKTWQLLDAGIKNPTFLDYAQNVCFNVDACAASDKGEIFEAGLYKALETKELELLYPKGLFPHFTIMRAAVMCKNLGLTPGPKLRAYTDEHRPTMKVPVILAKMVEHYGAQHLTEEELRAFCQ